MTDQEGNMTKCHPEVSHDVRGMTFRHVALLGGHYFLYCIVIMKLNNLNKI